MMKTSVKNRLSIKIVSNNFQNFNKIRNYDISENCASFLQGGKLILDFSSYKYIKFVSKCIKFIETIVARNRKLTSETNNTADFKIIA